MKDESDSDTATRNVSILFLLFLGITVLTLQPAAAGVIEGHFHPSGYYGVSPGNYAWEDYCPLCHHGDCLLINPKGTREGEITCGVCDADYDGTSGADKFYKGCRGWLTPYTVIEEQEPAAVEVSVPVNQTEVFINKWMGYRGLEVV